MNITDILTSLKILSSRTIAVARQVVQFVGQTYDHLPGDARHLKAFQILTDAVPALPKWAAHALVALVFGTIQKGAIDAPRPATPPSDTQAATDHEATRNRNIASVFELDPLTADPPGLGELLPPPAAQPQLPPLRPQAPVPIQ